MNRAKMNKLASQLKSMYLTENPVNYDDNWHGCKYFICFHNTHRIPKGFSNIPDTVEFLNDVIQNGFSVDGATFFKKRNSKKELKQLFFTIYYQSIFKSTLMEKIPIIAIFIYTILYTSKATLVPFKYLS